MSLFSFMYISFNSLLPAKNGMFYEMGKRKNLNVYVTEKINLAHREYNAFVQHALLSHI